MAGPSLRILPGVCCLARCCLLARFGLEFSPFRREELPRWLKARAILRRLPMKTSTFDTRRCHPPGTGSRRLLPGRILLWAPLVQYQPRRKPAKPVTTQERTSRKKTSVRSPTESSWVTTGSMRSPPTCGPHKLWTHLSQNGPSRVPIPNLLCSCHSHMNVIMQHLAPHFLFKHNSCNSFSRCVMGKVTTPTGWLNIWCPENPAVLLSAHCPSSCKWGSSSDSDGAVGAPQELGSWSLLPSPRSPAARSVSNTRLYCLFSDGNWCEPWPWSGRSSRGRRPSEPCRRSGPRAGARGYPVSVA